MKSARPIVLVTWKGHKDALRLLRQAGIEVKTNNQGRPLTRDELIKELKNVDAVVSLGEIFDKEVIESSKRLKVISRYGAGYDYIDLDAATKNGVYVAITPFAPAEAVADATIGLMLSVARKLSVADKFVKEKKWTEIHVGSGLWTNSSTISFLGIEMCNKTLGIIGLGKIGTLVAKRALGFGMKIIYYDILRSELVERLLGIEYVTLDELLSRSDFVSIHTPLNETTEGLIGEKELKKMKKTAFLINTARGKIVDQEALVRALKERWIAGAGLDVFEKEPIDLHDPILELDNVVLIPHIAAFSLEAFSKMAIQSAQNVLAVLRGERPLCIVNPEALEFTRK